MSRAPVVTSISYKCYCLCGGKLHASSSPPEGAKWLVAQFETIHSGEGHGPCDARTAAKARRLAELHDGKAERDA